MSNLLSGESLFFAPLKREFCTEILYQALYKSAKVSTQIDIPPTLDLPDLIRRATVQGPGVYIMHPAIIDRIFCGVTVSTLKTIRELYCSRLERSIQVVGAIINKKTMGNTHQAISQEAIWAICHYLDEKRVLRTAVTIRIHNKSWVLIRLSPNIVVQGDRVYSPIITCVLDTEGQKVLSFVVGSQQEVDIACSQAIYEAIVHQRESSLEGIAGLVWNIPLYLETDEKTSTIWSDACKIIGIRILPLTTDIPLQKTLYSNWERDLPSAPIPKGKLEMIFDTYLHRIHGYGPHRQQAEQAEQLRTRVAYNRDPTWQFPALRNFLPKHLSQTDDIGNVIYKDRSYYNQLLTYWPQESVYCQPSWFDKSTAWIYIGDDLLCQAVEQEALISAKSNRNTEE